MNDAADIVRDYLLTISAITTLTGTGANARLWAELDYPPSGYKPSDGGAIVFKADGAGYLAENAILRTRWQFKCYGIDVYKIRAVHSALLDAMHDTRGRGNILSSQPQGPGTMLSDPRNDWPFKLEFIETTTYSGLPTYAPA